MASVLDPFDATRKFKSLTFFRADGTIWSPGSAIDDARFTERQLQLLYDNRRIGYITDDELKALAARADQEEQDRRDAAAMAAGTSGTVNQPVALPDPLLSTESGPSTLDKDAAAQALVDAHTKDELVGKATTAGVEIKPSDTKPVIAAALVEAGVTAPAVDPALEPDHASAAAETGSEGATDLTGGDALGDDATH